MDPIALGAVVAAAWLLTRKGAPPPSDADHGGGGASVGGAEQGAEPSFNSGMSTGAAAASIAPGEIVSAENPITGAPTSVGHDGAGATVHEETGSSGKTPTTGRSPFTDEVGDVVDRTSVGGNSFVTVGDSEAVLASNVREGGRYGVGDAFAVAPHIRTDIVKSAKDKIPSKTKAPCACVKPPCACSGPAPKKPGELETPDKPSRSSPIMSSTSTSPGTGIMPPNKTTAKDQARALQALGPRVGSVW